MRKSSASHLPASQASRAYMLKNMAADVQYTIFLHLHERQSLLLALSAKKYCCSFHPLCACGVSFLHSCNRLSTIISMVLQVDDDMSRPNAAKCHLVNQISHAGTWHAATLAPTLAPTAGPIPLCTACWLAGIVTSRFAMIMPPAVALAPPGSCSSEGSGGGGPKWWRRNSAKACTPRP